MKEFILGDGSSVKNKFHNIDLTNVGDSQQHA